MTDASSTEPGDDAIPALWPNDRAVLIHLVRQLEHEGRDTADVPAIFAALGLTDEEGHRIIDRLQRDDLISISGGAGARGIRDGGVYLVRHVTGDGLRRAGAWPSDAETVAGQLITALAEAAANEPDWEKRTRLQQARDGLAAVGQKTVVDITAAYLAKISGA